MIENRIIWQNLLFSDAIEGGYSAPRDGDPNPTMHGVTLKTLQAWRAPKIVTIDNLKALTVDEAKVIASASYWAPVQGDKLPGGLDVMLGDCSFNSGPRQAVKLLQGCLGFTGDDRDGFLGILTLKATLAADPRQLIRDYHAARLAFLRQLPTWESNGRGWSKRLDAMLELALTLAPAEAPTVTAKAGAAKTNLVAQTSMIGVLVSTVLPPIVEAIPAAKSAYTSTADLLAPYGVALPMLIPVVGGLVIVGILYTRYRASKLAKAALDTGASGVVIA